MESTAVSQLAIVEEQCVLRMLSAWQLTMSNTALVQKVSLVMVCIAVDQYHHHAMFATIAVWTHNVCQTTTVHLHVLAIKASKVMASIVHQRWIVTMCQHCAMSLDDACQHVLGINVSATQVNILTLIQSFLKSFVWTTTKIDRCDEKQDILAMVPIVMSRFDRIKDFCCSAKVLPLLKFHSMHALEHQLLFQAWVYIISTQF